MKTMLIAFLLGLFVANVASKYRMELYLSTEAHNTYWDCVESKLTEDEIKTISSFLTCVNKDSTVDLINYFCSADDDEAELFRPTFSNCMQSFPASFNTRDLECLAKASQ
ncbi:venom protein 184-like isoform X1 [Centruroides vittatus]|uniref:venom protein 184-like isoform X1 n=1 Tax=Centruroides vittatus TaxID=120091 RepID=UPI00350ECFB3